MALKPNFSDREFCRYAMLLLFAGMGGSVESPFGTAVHPPEARTCSTTAYNASLTTPERSMEHIMTEQMLQI